MKQLEDPTGFLFYLDLAWGILLSSLGSVAVLWSILINLTWSILLGLILMISGIVFLINTVERVRCHRKK